jgi:AhpD family alkylhydroperoxidase
MFRTMANRPEIFETIIAHFEAILNTGTAPVKLKELVIVRTSQIDCCEYCLGSNTQIAQRLGWSRNRLKTWPILKIATISLPPIRPPCGWPRR